MHAASLPTTAADAPRARKPGLVSWRRLLREPLLHFVLLGILIFSVAHIVEDAKRASQARVIIDSALKQRLANVHRAQFGVSPTAAQLNAIVDNYVDDEVLYREAIRLGLDQDDEIIRRRLIQKLEFLQRDSGAQADPTPSELRAYYDSHLSRFTEGARVSFTHLYFSPDRGGDADALSRATHARAELLASGDTPEADAFPLQDSYDSISRDDAIQLFGASAFTDTLFATSSGDWSQPARSGFGWHLIKVTASLPAHVASYEEVAPDVRSAWQQELTARAKRKQLDALRVRYHVANTERASASNPGANP